MSSSHVSSILIINPNTTLEMTNALKPLIDKLDYEWIYFEYFTAPSGVSSIDNEDDALISADHCFPELVSRLSDYDAFLVCCYSQHPLVPRLRSELAKLDSSKPVAGIFDASITTCLQCIDTHESFGIVSTGSQWEAILGEAVGNFLGAKHSERYAGTKTTGLNADELHSTSKEEVERRMKKATKQLLANGARAICLGCAGMAGMEQTVRQACIDELGEEPAKTIRVVDGVTCGVIVLEGALRAGL